MSTIYVPGRGVVDLACRNVDQAVNEYDERLFAARHPHNGQDTIFLKMSPFAEPFGDDGLDIHGQRCIPIMAFPTGFPETHEVLGRLHRADAVRRGDEILDEINRHNDKVRGVIRARAAERAGEVAEIAESAFHREGKTSYHRSFAKRDPKHRG